MTWRQIPASRLALTVCLVWGSVGTALAQPFLTEGSETDSLPPVRIPLEEIRPGLRQRVQRVLEQPTFSTRGPVQVFAGPSALYYWFLDHPDRAAAAWRRLGAECLNITDRGGGRFGWKDDQGSDVAWELACSGPRMRVWYAEGKVRPAALLPLVPVSAVMVLNHQEGHDGRGRPMLRHQANLVLHADSKTAVWVARLLGPSAPRLAEQYVAQIQLFFAALVWYLDKHPERAATLLPGNPFQQEPAPSGAPR